MPIGKDKINAKVLKARLALADYDKIAKALGLREYSRDDHQVIYYNATKHKEQSKQSPKLYHYNDTHIYCDYTKGATYDVIGLVQTVKTVAGESCSFLDAVRFIMTVCGIDGELVAIGTSSNTYNWEDSLGRYLKIKRGENLLPTFDDNILDSFPLAYHEDWLAEGITKNSIEKYGIRWYERTQQLLIPCRNKAGDLIGIRTRNFEPLRLESAKYIPLMLLNEKSYAFPTNQCFYGINYNWAEIERTGHITLVEGEKSVLKADGWFGQHSDVLAMYGSTLGLKRRNDLLKMGVNSVTIAIDSDYHTYGDENYDQFEKKVKTLARLFQGYATVDVMYNNQGWDWYKCSPFDGTYEQYQTLWENREVVL